MDSQIVRVGWEYTITTLMGAEMMNSYGNKGWELVSANDGRLYWKRPLTALQSKGKVNG